MTVYRSEDIGQEKRVVSVRFSDVYSCPKSLLGGDVQIDIRKMLRGERWLANPHVAYTTTMSVVTKLTEQEFLAMPDEPGKQELLDGELISMPPAKQTHNHIAMRFFKLLDAILRGSRVHHEAGFKLRSGRWLQPDVSVIWPEQLCGEWFERSPMTAIKIVSPGNTDNEIDRKVVAYLEDGAAEVWIVRPETESMTVYRNEDAARERRVVSVRYSDVYSCPKALLGDDVQIDVRKMLHGE